MRVALRKALHVDGEADVRDGEFRTAVRWGDVERDLGAGPLLRRREPWQVTLGDTPDDAPAGIGVRDAERMKFSVADFR